MRAARVPAKRSILYLHPDWNPFWKGYNLKTRHRTVTMTSCLVLYSPKKNSCLAQTLSIVIARSIINQYSILYVLAHEV